MKEPMLILARTAALTGERDRRYTRQFQEFTGRLQAMTDLHDLAPIRNSRMQSAIDLKTCVEAMAEESEQSVARMREDVRINRRRLENAERLAGQVSLTGLDNRRRVESSIEYRIEHKKLFSVLLIDLNGFKQLNDTYGRQAADELLQQFGKETGRRSGGYRCAQRTRLQAGYSAITQ